MANRARATTPIPSAADPMIAAFTLRDAEEMRDREVVMRGRLDAEIKRLIKVKEEAEAAMHVVTTVAAADKAKEEADEYARDARAGAEVIISSARETQKNAETLAKEASAREAAVSKREADVLGRETLLTNERQNLTRDNQQAKAAIHAELKKMADDRRAFEEERLRVVSALSNREVEVAQRERRLKEQLAAVATIGSA